MDQTKRKANNIETVIGDKRYPSIRKAAIAKGIPPYVVYNRISLYGMSKEEALNKPLSKPVSVVIDGVEYPSLKKAYEELGKVSFSEYQYRRSKVNKAGGDIQKHAKHIIGLETEAP